MIYFCLFVALVYPLGLMLIHRHRVNNIKKCDDIDGTIKDHLLITDMRLIIEDMKKIQEDLPLSSETLKPKKPDIATVPILHLSSHHRRIEFMHAEEPQEPPQEEYTFDVPSPRSIKEKLDQFVIGQDKAKKILSVAASNHYKRLAHNHFVDVPIKKSNIMLIGPTGSGKTLLVQTLAKSLDVPMIIDDATGFTEAGYVGRNVEELVHALIRAANMSTVKASKGIIYIDEIDKIAATPEQRYIDVGGRGVQQALLKLIEGTTLPLSAGWGGPFDTSNVLFIVGGAFAGIEEIVKTRTEAHHSMGFGATIKDKDKELPQAITEDLVRFGMIPELMGRVPLIASLKELTKGQLMQVLTDPKDALVKEYQALMQFSHVDLQFDYEAIELIAEEAIKRKTGARGLRSIMEAVLLDSMYNIDDYEDYGYIDITKDTVREKLNED